MISNQTSDYKQNQKSCFVFIFLYLAVSLDIASKVISQ